MSGPRPAGSREKLDAQVHAEDIVKDDRDPTVEVNVGAKNVVRAEKANWKLSRHSLTVASAATRRSCWDRSRVSSWG